MQKEFLQGICAHGEALFAYYKKYKKEALKPPIRTSFQAHAMIREYTNRAVADILEEEEGSQVRIEPVLFLEGRDIQAEFKLGRERMYALRDLPAFCTALEGELTYPMERSWPSIIKERSLNRYRGCSWI